MKARTISACFGQGVLILPLLTGCGEQSNEVSVAGQFTLQNTPIARGAVTFFPERGRPITTATDEQGQYMADLAPGEYRVTVNIGVQLPPGWKEGDPVPPQKASIPAQFTSRVNTPLKMTVTESGAEPSDFNLP